MPTGTIVNAPGHTNDPPPCDSAKNVKNANSRDEWSVPIHHPILLLPTDITAETTNICDIIGKDSSLALDRLICRFCPKLFEKTETGKRLLKESLVRAAKQSGLSLVSGSGRSSASGTTLCFCLVCDCSLTYKFCGNPMNAPTSTSERPDTKRVVNAALEGRCKFRLPIYVDALGYFIRGRSGCSTHSHHSVAAVAPTRTTASKTKRRRKRKDPLPSAAPESNLDPLVWNDNGMDEAPTLHRDPLEEWTPLFHQLVDMAQCSNGSHRDETIDWGKDRLTELMTELQARIQVDHDSDAFEPLSTGTGPTNAHCT